ncbi:hypothetical protein SH668x_000767 [Planctomicrobium sp. SH668]|uniref:hypothetical protein n=1 Tax=Planctomicrobium sp. SH668 TaxID=3448126 RepID=UPI003F5B1CCE
MATLSELRRRFLQSPNSKLVSPDVYIEGLTGHRSLVRCDEPSANLLGLLDETTGGRILVPVEELARRKTLRVERVQL